MRAENLSSSLVSGKPFTIRGVDDHALSYLTAEMVRHNPKHSVVLIARDHTHLTQCLEDLRTFLPEHTVLPLPAWDVEPYDRLSADHEIQAQRMRAVAAISSGTPVVIVATVNALMTKIPPRQGGTLELSLQKGQHVDRDRLIRNLEGAGYHRVSTVMEPSEFAVRGALIDLFPAGEPMPLRLDFFDDELEAIHRFDPQSQRSQETVAGVMLHTASEVVLNEDTIRNFRQHYRSMFPEGLDDTIYRDISSGIPHPAMGHFMPLFYEQPLGNILECLAKDSIIVTHSSFEHAASARWEQTNDAFQSRQTPPDVQLDDDMADTYRALPVARLYVSDAQLQAECRAHRWLKLAPLDNQESADADLNLREHLSYSAQRTPGQSIAEKLAKDIREARKTQQKVVLSAFAPSTLDRLKKMLAEQDIHDLINVPDWPTLQRQKAGLYGVISPLAWGFTDADHKLILLTEQDLFGERQNRPTRSKRRSGEEVLNHFSELQPGDYVVHAEHGIGRFDGLETISVGGHEQDFLQLIYDGGDKLYVPVVSLDVLSRYSSSGDETIKCDKLGAAAWQARKARVREKLLDMAENLIKVAAAREMRRRPAYHKPEGLYDEFVSGFPFVPTSEQKQAIDDVEADLFSDRPMDRLVVGDVGFGKTEVALRAAFVAAADGRQVAIIVPTTLLARQHYTGFKKRFAGFPLNVAMLSRLTKPAEARAAKEGLKNGNVDIVIGTHALLAKDIHFHNLGLVVIDEEQRFGVRHKEKLKELKNLVDVLTLTATPIPRTMQMSMSGLRSLSTITTPPVDRLAVRTFLMGFDAKSIREAILREVFRGGQVYVVTPRVEGIERLADNLRKIVPEAKIRVAHGQMNRDELDDVMTDFYDGQFNVLVSTTIVESGIDVPKANTIIINQANRFGLAQLYQLRGRVGRSKVRAYAYLLLPHGGRMTDQAHKRLQVLQRLDGLGAGFTLASYDLDIRGPGNLLGDEQSGHIREVGFELYNQMLKEAIDAIRYGHKYSDETSTEWSPALNLGLTYRIPEDYVADLSLRMQMYRRLSSEAEGIEDLRDEMRDRFGELPQEVEALLEVVKLRNRCKVLGIEKVDVGDKGTVVAFRNGKFENPQGLLQYILSQPGLVSLRPDHKIVLHRRWLDAKTRLRGMQEFLTQLEALTNGQQQKQA